METRSVLVMNWRDLANPAAGGAEVYTHEVLKRIAARGHEVTLLTSGFRGGRHEEVLDGVRILRVGDRFSVYRRARRVYRDRFKARVGVVVDEINTRPFHTPPSALSAAISSRSVGSGPTGRFRPSQSLRHPVKTSSRSASGTSLSCRPVSLGFPFPRCPRRRRGLPWHSWVDSRGPSFPTMPCGRSPASAHRFQSRVSGS
ncbi:MAG: hypothetical protein E6K03_04005 [Methanobacteriota archaeon]|nr:MAG: hypothetical protein E6K03_04005 [Euryarchaeota archaeon]